MTAITIYRPLKTRLGKVAALLASFIFSGFLHELALSLPVNNGYGWPTLYFVIQALALLLENALKKRLSGLFASKLFVHLWVLVWVVAPAPLLFHAAFISEIVWPLAGLKPL